MAPSPKTEQNEEEIPGAEDVPADADSSDDENLGEIPGATPAEVPDEEPEPEVEALSPQEQLDAWLEAGVNRSAIRIVTNNKGRLTSVSLG